MIAFTRIAPIRHSLPKPASAVALPAISPTLLRFFTLYTRLFLGRHFRSIHLIDPPPSIPNPPRPTVIYLNHASWWDPLICLLLRDRFTIHLNNFAPIDNASLAKFRFFRKLGFFGVDKNSHRGTVHFLRTSARILSDTRSVLWITPQGDFIDPRVRPTELKHGIGHLTEIDSNPVFIPLALDYFFSGDRLPSVAASFGEPIDALELSSLSSDERTEHLAAALERRQDALADQIKSKKVFSTPTLLSGKSGTGGIYGVWQSLRRTQC